jgi:hypothetical protein
LYVASIGATWNLQQTHSPRIGYSAAVDNLILSGITIPILMPHLNLPLDVTPLLPQTKEFAQSKFMLNIKNSLKNNLMERFDVRRKTIVTGRSCRGASYWLTSPPNWEDNSFIDAAPFRLLLKYK